MCIRDSYNTEDTEESYVSTACLDWNKHKIKFDEAVVEL